MSRRGQKGGPSKRRGSRPIELANFVTILVCAIRWLGLTKLGARVLNWQQFCLAGAASIHLSLFRPLPRIAQPLPVSSLGGSTGGGGSIKRRDAPRRVWACASLSSCSSYLLFRCMGPMRASRAVFFSCACATAIAQGLAKT